MTQVRYGIPGVLPENTWMSDEMVSGGQPCAIAGSATREVEAAAAVADIEDHAALLGRERRGQQPPVLHDVGEGAGDIGRAGIGMGEDIARPQRVEDLRHQFARLHAADMAHDLAAGASPLARRDRPLQRFKTVLGDHVLGHAHFDAQHHVGVLGDRLRGGVDLREIDVVKLGDRERRQPHIGDVHKGVKTRARLRDDVAAECREIVGAGIAGRNAGCAALVRHKLVRRNTDRRAVGVDVAMQVDQSGRDQLAAGVEHPQRARGGNVGLDRLDQAIADADVAPAAQRLAGIEHIGGLDHEIELVVRPHRAECLAGQRGSERERAGTGEEFAT